MAGFEIWLVVAIIFFIGEMFTEGFFLTWFGVGGLAAALAAFFGVSDDITQWIIFLVVSVILLLFTRRFADRITKKAPRDAAIDALIGQKAHVIETIDPEENTGRVRIRKDEWRADAEEKIPVGEKVEVTGVEGAHVIVKKM
ncbi:MAG: NfeD family protein [Candidatus Altiarchaeota archaeon]|nr:NfeD family protein [Candidatus Altiarchaeota archaeon]